MFSAMVEKWFAAQKILLLHQVRKDIKDSSCLSSVMKCARMSSLSGTAFPTAIVASLPIEYTGIDIIRSPQKPSETIDGLDGKIPSLNKLCEYSNCYTKLFKIQLLDHAVKRFEVYHWIHEEEKG